MTNLERKRGRPKKFRGDKDARDFAEILDKLLPIVVEFIVTWRVTQDASLRTKGVDRYQQALADVAAKYGMSARTLERRYDELRFIANPIAEIQLSSANPPPIPLAIEYFPRDKTKPR